MTVSKKKTKCLSCFHKIRKGFGDNETAVRKDSPLACVSKVFFFLSFSPSSTRATRQAFYILRLIHRSKAKKQAMFNINLVSACNSKRTFFAHCCGWRNQIMRYESNCLEK